MSEYMIVIMALVMAAVVLLTTILGICLRRTGREIIDLWVKVHGFELVQVNRVKAPLVEEWAVTEGYEFYYVVLYKSGDVRRAWIRCPRNENADAGDCKVVWCH